MSEDFTGRTHAENRRYPRVQLKLWVHFRLMQKGDISSPQESLAQDLGAQGMAMRSDHALRVGQLLRAVLYLPPEEKRGQPDETPIFTEEESLPVEILSRVVWCQPLENNEFMLGVQFLDPEPKHRSRLKSFLIDYHLDQPDSALYI